jgi:hypothetical protein
MLSNYAAASMNWTLMVVDGCDTPKIGTQKSIPAIVHPTAQVKQQLLRAQRQKWKIAHVAIPTSGFSVSLPFP